MLHTSFNEFFCSDALGVVAPRMVKIGRGVLGVYVWRLLDELMRPMNSVLQSAWARATARNPEQAIRDYAEVRGAEVSSTQIESLVDEFLTDRSGYAKA